MVKNKKYKRLPIKLSEENLWSVCSYLHCNILAPTRISNEAESRASLVTARAVLVNKTVWVGTRLRVLFYYQFIRLLTVKQTLPISDPDLIDCLGWGLKVMFYKKCFLFVEFLIVLVLHKFPSFLITVSILAQSLHIVQCVRSYCPGAAMRTFIDSKYASPFLHDQTNNSVHLVLLMMIGFVCQI